MEASKRIPAREEIRLQDKWAIEDLYTTDEDWEAELVTLEEDKKLLVSFAGRLEESAETLCSYMTALEAMIVKTERLANYAQRKADENTRNTVYQAMTGRFTSVYVDLSTANSFDIPEIMAISDEKLEAFYRDFPPLERYRRYLSKARRMRPHTLSVGEERLLAAAKEMSQASENVYSTMTDADLTFPDAVDAQEGRHQLTQGTFVKLESSPDRVLRRSAYENFYDTFAAFRNTAAATLNGQNKQLKFFAEARKFPSAFEASLFRTEVPTAVYQNLIDAVHKNMDKMHRYVRLRKKCLGVEELHFYDIYTSLVSNVEKRIPYAEAMQTVYEAVAPLGPAYQAVLKEGFDNRWVDVYQNVGKRSGAYSAGCEVHPYVLMNYNETLDNQFTLAHEMGHAIHSYLSHKHQSPMDARYVIFVAEVASTCNEALLMEYLLNRTTDKQERAYLINHFLEQFKGTLYRQTMFAEFELRIGQMTAEGKTLTADLLSAEYKRLNAVYFGPDMVVDDRIAMEWARIPHFYYNYYVFQYATGYAAAIALSRRILTEGEPAVRAYLRFLSGGCSKPPLELLRDAGVDMASAEPVNQALTLFGQLVEEMEMLMED